MKKTLLHQQIIEKNIKFSFAEFTLSLMAPRKKNKRVYFVLPSSFAKFAQQLKISLNYYQYGKHFFIGR